jgi:membrane-associated protease RseP (regulator of RpoE activity)
MMMYVIGLVLFALAILISVALHECGHMWAARATGMKVRRYFVGFGPTLWSTKRPNKLGYTEYGIKAIPAGGFCDIAGMTANEELAPDDQPHAMFRQKVWKRVVVLFAGPGMNFAAGLVILYGIAIVWGLPNLHPPTAAIVGKTACVAPEVTKGDAGHCEGPGPAALAGIQPGDTVVKVGSSDVKTFDDMVAAVRKSTGPTPFVVQRTVDGRQTKFTTTVDVTPTQRWVADGDKTPTKVGAVGVAEPKYGPTQYNPLSAVPATFAFAGDTAVQLGKALAMIPTKFGALVHSIGGGERDPNTPISVVGASRIGGETVEHGLWVLFWLVLVQVNFALGAVNLLPLLPFDGGHIAVATYEKLRSMFRKARRLDAAGPVDYMKLMPATYVVIALLGAYMLLTVTADLVNPIRLFQ